MRSPLLPPLSTWLPLLTLRATCHPISPSPLVPRVRYAEFSHYFARDQTGMQKLSAQQSRREKLTDDEQMQKEALSQARDGLNMRFTDMRKAWKYVDLDNSGTVNRQELERALKMWGIEMSPAHVAQLWKACDTTGDGEISYAEFVSALARDTAGSTVAPAAPAAPRLTAQEQMQKDMLRATEDSLNSRFSNMRQAFKYVDLDNSGTVNRQELERALQMWNLPMSEEKVDALWAACDVDGSGGMGHTDWNHTRYTPPLEDHPLHSTPLKGHPLHASPLKDKRDRLS